jgi:hypothetical protein
VSKRKNLDDIIHGDRAEVRSKALTHKSNEVPKSSGWDSWGGGKFKACAETHPALPLPGSDHVIYGGSCSSPVHTDCDVYIGLSESMKWTQKHWPWKKGVELLFPITDMSVPKQPEEFAKLVKWTRKQLDAGLKVHCGCIGGHGRTGMLLSALVSTYGEVDAISYVREHYCKKAVESHAQAQFLNQYFGVKVVKGAKEGGSKTFTTTKYTVHDGEIIEPKMTKQPPQRISPIRDERNIWGPECN